MAIHNYSTQIAVEKTLMEIQKILVKAKASAILTEIDNDGIVSHLSFKIPTSYGLFSYRFPANIDKLYKVLIRDNVPTKLKTKEQACRVAWRIIKDWLLAQMAIIEVELVTLEEVFLPYMQDKTGTTLIDRFKKHEFKALGYGGD
jgi:hypothetical protein